MYGHDYVVINRKKYGSENFGLHLEDGFSIFRNTSGPKNIRELSSLTFLVHPNRKKSKTTYRKYSRELLLLDTII